MLHSKSPKFIALSGTVAALVLQVVVLVAPAQATSSDDLAWIGTSTNSSSDALHAQSATATSPTVVVASPIGNVLATDGTSFYFVQNGNLVKSDLTGANITTIKANLSAINSRLTNIVGLTISGNYAYVIGYVTASSMNNAGVWRIALADGTATRIDAGFEYLSSGIQTLAAQLIVATSTTVFWGTDDGLHSWTIGGTPTTENTVKAEGDFHVLAANTNVGNVYSLTQESGNLAITLNAGGGPATLFQRANGSTTWTVTSQQGLSAFYAAGLAMSTTKIYYTDFGGSVFSIAKTGGASTAVFTHNVDSEAIVVYAAPAIQTPSTPSQTSTPSPIASPSPTVLASTGAVNSPIAISFFLLALGLSSLRVGQISRKKP